MNKLFLFFTFLAVMSVAAFSAITRPGTVNTSEYAGLSGTVEKGQQLFWLGGCAACHSGAGTEGDALLVLSGGRRFATGFGTFVAPNISTDPVQGIGNWALKDLANALLKGTSPKGAHYYPAFPFASYARMTPQDVADLKAFLDALPASDRANEPHLVHFPFNFRVLLGGWKFLYLNKDPIVAGDSLSPQEARGRYLVEGPGHCGECHTPRDALGGMDRARWLAGAPSADGPGRVPDITPARLAWSADEIADYLKTGFTPDYDSAGGAMAEVVTNLSHLPDTDLAAIAAYLKQVPAAD
jgi:mono/diheme cytochrome c family protein